MKALDDVAKLHPFIGGMSSAWSLTDAQFVSSCCTGFQGAFVCPPFLLSFHPGGMVARDETSPE